MSKNENDPGPKQVVVDVNPHIPGLAHKGADKHKPVKISNEGQSQDSDRHSKIRHEDSQKAELFSNDD